MGICVTEVTPDEYKKFFSKTLVYDAPWFNELNKAKVEEVKYLTFSDNQKRFGLCVGKKKDEWMCPFSAPFQLMESFRFPIRLEILEEAIQELEIYLRSHQCRIFRWTLPPHFYQETMITMLENILFRSEYHLVSMDINFQFNLKKIGAEDLFCCIPRNGRKNLKISLSSGLEFKRCETMEEKKIAYDIIYENRQSKNYLLKMSIEEICRTIQIMPHDFFLVSKNDTYIASAIIFYVTDTIAQVIYWGDRPGYTELKPINFLSYQLIEFYHKKGMDYLDIGPSSEKGVPNYGLCSFKISIGCECSSKLTVEKVLI